ncbi:MAG: dicarboxylate/amino acid:cation symporter [Gammaproteobacteria bacterium]|nr:dicarboxylate/amino acid:cation symporter [Gammaproteobacteria bacterium]
MVWYNKLHWRIISGLVLGIIYGVIAAASGWASFTNDWISPFGTIFLNGLKLIGVPLVLGSLVTGIASLSDIKKLSRIGGRTIAIYIVTTAVAVIIGLVLVNLIEPGKQVPAQLRVELQESYSADVEQADAGVSATRERGPLAMLVELIPENFFASASENRNMLQVVIIAIFVGVGLIQLPNEKAKPLVDVFDSLSHLVIRLVDLIMKMAPLGVFALIAGTITTVAGDDPGRIAQLLGALGLYVTTVVTGLLVHVLVTYGALLTFWTPMGLKTFLQGIAPAQLVAFSTSSSGATLPVTMERVEEKLGVHEDVSSFVLPLGATINMDGTAVYQAIAAVFIAQSLGMELNIAAQLTIILTAVMASIGTPAVPGAGIIMLVIILESVGVPSAGIALILGVDRILDMLRTAANVTGDATVCIVVAHAEGQLGEVDLSEEQDRIRVRTERP